MDCDMEKYMTVKARVFWVSYFLLIGVVIVLIIM